MINKGFKYRIYPNKEQKEIFEKHFGCARFVYNYGLNRKINEYKETRKTLSYFVLQNELPELKKEYEWLKEVNSQSLQMALRNLDNAFTRFFKLKSGFPKFKSKKCNHQSFQVPQHYRIENNNLKLPKIKSLIKLKYNRELEEKPKTLTVSKVPSGKYFISIVCEIDEEYPEKVKIEENTTVGIDLGIKTFATLSNGVKIENPRHLQNSLQKLKREQKKLSGKKKGSNNRSKQRIKVARVYEKITNQRKDFLHKFTSKLICENQTICIEDLSVKSMLKKDKKRKYINRAILDVGWYEFRRQLEYKSLWYGKNVIVIGRFEPSSKLCNICCKVNNDLKLSDREWKCECGAEHDRDVLAANNIKTFGLSKNVGQGLSEVKPVRYDLSLEGSEQEIHINE